MTKTEKICTKYINLLGNDVVLTDDKNKTCFSAILQETWRRNKTNFEFLISQAGLTGKEYYLYIGPAKYDISHLTDSATLSYSGEKFKFVKTEKVCAHNTPLFCTGILKRLWMEETDVN